MTFGKNGLDLHADDLRAMGQDISTILQQLPKHQAEELKYNWPFWARPEQMAPASTKDGKPWNNWLINAGRGFGKTRAGVEWVRHQVKSGKRRVMAVASTNSDIERVMVKGESGFLACCWKGDKTYTGKVMGYPEWSPTKRTLTWENGANVTFFSAEEPERLRGPQGDASWCFIKGTTITTLLGDKDVSNVSVGDFVLTRDGYKEVIATSDRIMPVGTVTFSDNRALTGTPEHPIYTDRGWINLGDLVEGDKVCVLPVLNGTEDAGTSMKGGITTSTVQSVLVAKTENTYTEQFTNLFMEIFQKAFRFTTSMVTSLTTALRTCLVTATLSIKKYTSSKHLYAVTGETNPHKAHVALTVKNLCNVKSLLSRLFANLVHSSVQKMLVRLKESANTAEQSSSQGLETSVVSVVSTLVGGVPQRVYNLQVKDKPEYYANGILVHNCDELCAWNNDRDTWDMLQFCLRLGTHPQIAITTTPKPTKLIRDILKNPKTVVTSGSTFDNAANLADTYVEAVRVQYEGTRIGRQELYAEILDEASGALWTRDILSRCEMEIEDTVEFSKTLSRVVVSVDPAVSSNAESDMTGLVVAGIDVNGICYVLEDATERFTPEGWANKAVELYTKYSADRIVAERNQGGEMVRHTLHTVDETVPIRLVHASRGKFARAEPVSALYERDKVKHCRGLDLLEDQLVQWEPLGSIGSPDRLDALVWAITDLALKGVSRPELDLAYSDSKGLLSKI
jgi:phage terminase large subunit-like protein